MLQQALETEVEEYVTRHRATRDEQGRAQVVRNGKAPARQLVTGTGTLEVRAPRVNDRRVDAAGQRQRFTSEILPTYMRRAPKVTEVLPILYLRGLSTGDFQAALPVLLGKEAAGLSPTTITRLTASWDTEYQAWRTRRLAEADYVYVWVDGVHFRVRLEEDRLCTLVMIGVRPDGTKELIAVEDGYRESTDSWSTVLRDLKRRGLRAPVVAVGDGALGFWAAVGAVWPETREQRCWVHRLANVLDKLPKRLQPKAKQALHGIMQAPTRAEAEARHRRLRSRVRREVSQSGHVVAARPGPVADVLRLSGRALAASAHDQHHRVTVCDGAAAATRHEGRRLSHQGAAHGLQAARDGGRALAKSEWTRTSATGSRRCSLRGRRAGDTEEPDRGGEGERRLAHAAIHNI